MKVAPHRLLLTNALILSLAACAGGSAVKYHFDPAADAGGYRFVIPRTVIKVTLASETAPAVDHPDRSTPKSPLAAQSGAAANPADAAAAKTAKLSKGPPPKLSLTPVPVNYDRDAKALPIYSVTDDTGGWSLVSTSITNVKYADSLIIQAIGTQVTDNRKDAIATVVGIAGLAGAFAAAEGCTEQSPLLDFLIDDDLSAPSKGPIPAGDNTCWGYKITEIQDIDPKSQFPIPQDGKSALPLDTSTKWFPYPACKSVKVSVFPCEKDAGNPKVCTVKGDAPHYDGVVSVADGSAFRRVPLPQKGKVEMHSDFCIADTTSDTSPLSSDWSLVSEAIKDVKDQKKK